MRALLMNTFNLGAPLGAISQQSVELYLYTSKAKQASKLYHFICFQYYYEKQNKTKKTICIYIGSSEDFSPYANQSRVGLDSLIPTFLCENDKAETLIQFKRNPSIAQAKLIVLIACI